MMNKNGTIAIAALGALMLILAFKFSVSTDSYYDSLANCLIIVTLLAFGQRIIVLLAPLAVKMTSGMKREMSHAEGQHESQALLQREISATPSNTSSNKLQK